MGDYVLESNPALGRLIERLGAEGKRPRPEESASSQYARRFQRRGRSKTPKRARENATTAGAQKRSEVASFVKPTSIVEDDLCVIHEDLQAADEIVLVDSDEEPAAFAEQRGDGESLFVGDEANEVLDIYGHADLDECGESAWGDAEAFDQMGTLLEEDEGGDWIFDAFKAWMLEVEEAIA